MLPNALAAGGCGSRCWKFQPALSRQERRSILFAELHLKLLEHYGPPSAVVNHAYDIVHLSERACRYLRFAAGEPSANLLKVIYRALRVELRTALFRAAQEGQTRERCHNGRYRARLVEVITVRVRRIRKESRIAGFLSGPLLEFLAAEPAAMPVVPPHDAAHELEQEMRQLQAPAQQNGRKIRDGSRRTESSNEELQAMNEEMRSATEELETSQEELQSVNEELITVNNELKNNVEALSRANSRSDQPHGFDRDRDDLPRSASCACNASPRARRRFSISSQPTWAARSPISPTNSLRRTDPRRGAGPR